MTPVISTHPKKKLRRRSIPRHGFLPKRLSKKSLQLAGTNPVLAVPDTWDGPEEARPTADLKAACRVGKLTHTHKHTSYSKGRYLTGGSTVVYYPVTATAQLLSHYAGWCVGPSSLHTFLRGRY